MTRLSPQTRRAVIKYGPQLNAMARGYGIKGKNPGARLLAKLVIGESGDRADAVSSAGAKGRTQFMPGTRQGVLRLTGGRVDPWGSADDAVEAAVLHLTGQLGHRKGLEGYNPGDPTYASYILSQKVGGLGGAPPTVDSGGGGTELAGMRGTEKTTDLRSAILDSLMNRSSRRGSLLQDINARVQSGAYTSTQSWRSPAERLAANGPPPTVEGGGDFTVRKGANRAGVPLNSSVTGFASRLAARAGTFEIGTGSQHSQFTVSGRVSEHWGGNAMDIPASGQRLIELMTGALIEAGVNPKKAKRMAKNGGLYNITRGGKRYQIIGRTNEGGNHWDHLHVGISGG